MTYPIQKTDAEWKALLAEKGAEPGAFQVTRQAATERPYTGKYERVWADGSYHCICCGNKLFDAGTGADFLLLVSRAKSSRRAQLFRWKISQGKRISFSSPV